MRMLHVLFAVVALSPEKRDVLYVIYLKEAKTAAAPMGHRQDVSLPCNLWL
jgi:hypothetical protein